MYADLHNRNTGAYIKKEYGYVNGTTALTRSGMSVDTTMAPGEWVTFQILFSDVGFADTEARNIRVVYDTYDSAPETKAKPVVTLLQSVEDKWGEWSAVGVVENQGSETAYFVKVQCDLFCFKDQALGHLEDNYYFLGDDLTYVDGEDGTTPNGTHTDTILPPAVKGTFWTSLSGVPFDLVQYARTTTNWDEYGSRTSSLSATASPIFKPAKFDGREAWVQYKQQQEAIRAEDPGQMQIQLME